METQKKRRFNIIDLIVLVILLAAVVFFAIRMLKPEEAEPVQHMGTARIVVEVDGIRESFFEELEKQIPCQMLANGKLADAYVTDLHAEPCQVAYKQAANPVNGTETQYVVPDASIPYVNAFFTVEAPVDLDSDTNFSLSQELRLGRIYYIKGKTIELAGTIVELELGE